MSGDDEILRIYLGGNTQRLISRIRSYSPALADKVKDMGETALRKVSDLGMAAYQTKVPIDTGELRGFSPDSGLIIRHYSSMEVTICIKGVDHIGADGKAKPAIDLANILDAGVGDKGKELTRTKKSLASRVGIIRFSSEAYRSETRDWEGKAYNAVIKVLPRFLSSVRVV